MLTILATIAILYALIFGAYLTVKALGWLVCVFDPKYKEYYHEK